MAGKNEGGSFLMIFVKIVLILGMVCFALPFVTVSCGDVEVTAKGYELATGQFSDEFLKEYGEIKPNVFVILSAICMLSAFLSAFARNDGLRKSTAAECFVSAAFAIAFAVSFMDYYEFNETDRELLEVSYGSGLLGVVAANVVAFILSIADAFITGVSRTVVSYVGKRKIKSDYNYYDEEKTMLLTDYGADLKKDRLITKYKEGKIAAMAEPPVRKVYDDENLKKAREYTGESRLVHSTKSKKETYVPSDSAHHKKPVNEDKNSWFQSGGDL